MFSNLAKVAFGIGGLPREPVRFRIAIKAALHWIMEESHQPTDWRKDQEIGQEQDSVRHDPADWKHCPHHREINRPNHKGKGEATSPQKAREYPHQSGSSCVVVPKKDQSGSEPKRRKPDAREQAQVLVGGIPIELQQ